MEPSSTYRPSGRFRTLMQPSIRCSVIEVERNVIEEIKPDIVHVKQSNKLNHMYESKTVIAYVPTVGDDQKINLLLYPTAVLVRILAYLNPMDVLLRFYRKLSELLNDREAISILCEVYHIQPTRSLTGYLDFLYEHDIQKGSSYVLCTNIYDKCIRLLRRGNINLNKVRQLASNVKGDGNCCNRSAEEIDYYFLAGRMGLSELLPKYRLYENEDAYDAYSTGEELEHILNTKNIESFTSAVLGVLCPQRIRARDNGYTLRILLELCIHGDIELVNKYFLKNSGKYPTYITPDVHGDHGIIANMIAVLATSDHNKLAIDMCTHQWPDPFSIQTNLSIPSDVITIPDASFCEVLGRLPVHMVKEIESIAYRLTYTRVYVKRLRFLNHNP